MFTKAKNIYNEFPLKFWILVIATFIDSVGGTIINPFFALYITQKFNVGMTEAGVLFAIFSVFGFLGSLAGGALTDKFGRRCMVLFGLVFSALSSVSMGMVDELHIFYLLAIIVGLLSNIGGPARQAMVADLLPEDLRSQGFGVLRVTGNLAWIVGPTIGGLLAGHSYMTLFVLDAVMSLITAAIVYKMIPETMTTIQKEGEPETSLWETVKGYRLVLADKLYLAFIITTVLMLVVYQQMYNTLSVYMRDVHSITTQQYGMMMSLNAGTVVLLQFWMTRKTQKYPPLLMMVTGTAFYMVGFTMYGLVSAYVLFIVATLIITFGEMIVIPVQQKIVADFAPDDMRGRYMACFSLAWTIPSAIGPWAAGMIMDNYNPDWVWYIAGIISAIAMVGFYGLHLVTTPKTIPETQDQKPKAFVVS